MQIMFHSINRPAILLFPQVIIPLFVLKHTGNMWKHYFLFTYFLLPFLSKSAFGEDPDVIIQAPEVASYGYWGRWENCSEGKLVTAFQIKMEAKHSVLDDTGLNGVRFFCGRPASKGNNQTVPIISVPDWENVTSSIGYFGNWGHIHNCTTYAIGFDLEAQPPQGKYKDDVGATNLKVLCADGATLEGYHYNGEGHSFPNVTYTGLQRCPVGHGMCGIRTRVEAYQTLGDDTGLNNLAAKCCPLIHSLG